MKLLDKLKNIVKFDKKIMLFLFVLGLIGLISGSIFVTILNNSDTKILDEQLNLFLDNIQNNNINYITILKNNLLTNIPYVIIIWLLGISIIGLPIILIMFFSKTFILGFTIASILSTYKFKGFLFALLYSFPGQILSIIVFSILTMYAMSFSFKLIYAIIKKKTIDFRLLMNKYLSIFVISLSIVIITNLYDTFVMPNLIEHIISFIR